MDEMVKLNRYDVVKCDFGQNDGSVQSFVRPGIVVSNSLNNEHSSVFLVLPLTSSIKRKHMPVHAVINSRKNGLAYDSMALGEQVTAVSKNQILGKLGCIRDISARRRIDMAVYNAFFYGEKFAANFGQVAH